MFPFAAFVDGQQASVAYDPSKSQSLVSYHFFSSALNQSRRHSSLCLITVETSDGMFSCHTPLEPLEILSCDVVLGRDWFNQCSTGASAAYVRTFNGQVLHFSASPFHPYDPIVPTDVIGTDSLVNSSLVHSDAAGASARLFEMQHTFSDSNDDPCSLPPLSSLDDVAEFLDSIEDMPKKDLFSILNKHGIYISYALFLDEIRTIFSKHVTSGSCGLAKIQNFFPTNQAVQHQLATEFDISFLSTLQSKIKLRTLRRLLDSRNVSFPPKDGVASLRRLVKKYVARLKTGKRTEERRNAQLAKEVSERQELHDTWPRLVEPKLKQCLVNLFREKTSSAALSTFVCAVCAESHYNHDQFDVLASNVNLDLLKARLPHSVPLPFTDGPLANVLVDPAGVTVNENGDLTLLLCKRCNSRLKQNKVPATSLANLTYLGPVPDILKDLTVIEEAMIARCRAKCWIVQLDAKNDDISGSTPDVQRGVKGHVIIYPQRPSEIAQILPPSLDDILTPVCVLFVGSSPPSPQWLRDKAKPLCVRREKVRAALLWLKVHNPLYKDITINHDLLNDLDESGVLPFHIEHIIPSDDSPTEYLTARYDDPLQSTVNNPDSSFSIDKHIHASNLSTSPPCPSTSDTDHTDVPFENVVITDVEGHAPARELRAAALRHVKNGGGYIQVPHDPLPVNEFFNPDLFPMIYPTLFPYGIGGFEDKRQTPSISMKFHVKHLFSLSDRRFQEHYSFLFTTFNILQRRKALLHTSLKVRKSNFSTLAADFASVSAETVHFITERISRGDSITANTPEERKVLNLMKQVNTVTSNVPGTSASRVAMRNEIRGLMIEKGMPSFFITINPADIYNPLVKFLGGSDIDIDNLLPEQVPNYWEQSILVARNPFIAAKFFNIYMKSFISSLLGYDPKQKDMEGGILGVVKAYYGCVEAQGRGTLHCHMMIWLEGGLNPNQIKDRVLKDGDIEFRDRLMAFLDDTISTCLPADPKVEMSPIPSSKHHPCSVRGVDPATSEDIIEHALQKDLHNVAKSCQVHSHSKTCFKYWKGPRFAKECRFDLDAENIRPETTFDMETGEICLRCLDGLVNNFNDTILQAIRCNMDIKFIGSGPAAKAIIYYITNYITKSQLKTHVAFAALELSVKKLGEYNPNEDDSTSRAKKLLQKCAYAMISHQELSGQQVASYLMDYEDHFTSHDYRNLYWTSFEGFINSEDPSPECYSGKSSCAERPDETDEYSEDTVNDDNDVGAENEPDNDSDANLPDTEEVTISMKSTGRFIATTNQVVDYQLRNNIFDSMCVWDFVSSVEKVFKKKHNRLADIIDEQLEDMDEPMECEDEPKSSKYPLRSDHPEHETHEQKLRSPRKQVIPVPIGPSIPRRDRKEIYPRYCRLMLILFRPWRHSSDLRQPGESWEDAFNLFLTECSPRIRELLNNMQLLHECRDNSQDYFTKRYNRSREQHTQTDSGEGTNRNDDFGPVDEEVLLEHLSSITACSSQYSARKNSEVEDCLLYAKMTGLFDSEQDHAHDFGYTHFDSIKKISSSDLELEQQWKIEYERRRDAQKKPASVTVQPATNSNASTVNHFVSDGHDLRQALQEERVHIIEPSIQNDFQSPEREADVSIVDMIEEFTLNSEQARAFKLICEQSLDRKKKPLRMYLGGAGGTGKSRVINALKEFFNRRGQSRRFRLASFAGIAAKNISGMTLHSALYLNQRRGKKAQMKTKRDLANSWEGVDYFFIDEVSTIGCKMLHDVSEALIDAKGDTSPFGGVNMILAGDFAQLPPVGETRLSSPVDTKKIKPTTPYNQAVIAGKLLWLSFTTVIILTEVMRQSGSANKDFVGLLQRLRCGKCTDDDYEVLSARVVGSVNIDKKTWADAPIIVSGNAEKDALNEYATQAFATRTNQELHWYHSTDTYCGQRIIDPALKGHLESLHSGKTNQRLGKIPLAIGMPVMIGQNYDLVGGIVNGCIGILKQIRYTEDGDEKRYATSCVVECDSISCKPLSTLPEKQAVVLEDTAEMVFEHPFTYKKCKIRRTQLPITPAFAMTAHKAQGQTMNHALVDIESCRGTEAPYVMVSRVTSLDGLLILRPFNAKKIKCRQSEDTRKEMERLEKLRLETIAEIGTAHEQRNAKSALRNDTHNRQSGRLTQIPKVNLPCADVNNSKQMPHSRGLKRPLKTSVACELKRQTKKRHIDSIPPIDHESRGTPMDIDVEPAVLLLARPKKVIVPMDQSTISQAN